MDGTRAVELMRVLVIDDDGDTRELVQMSLALARMETLTASSGADGLAKAARERPDAILLDVMMPFMDGPATLRALRADPRTADIPVLFLTASAMIAEVERLESLGVVGILAKPFDPATLGGRVRAALEKSPASRRPPSAPAAADLPRTLDDLRNAFVKTSLGKAGRATELVARLEAQPKDEEAREELMRFFHSLAGIGASHGFVQVTALAKEGELECIALKRAGAMPGPGEIDNWQRLIAALVHELKAPLPATHPLATPPPPLAEIDADAGPSAVLLVTADAGVRGHLLPLLEAEGLSVSEAGSLKDARAALADERALPSAVVVDVDLPDGSGHDLIVEIRRLSSGEGVAVLVMSPRGGFMDKVEAITSGADGYFEKPVDWKALLRRLQHLLEKSRPEPSKILSVEDDPEQAAYVRAILESAGHTVFVCSDPAQFDAMLRQHAPDLVLMDILLPGVTGYDLVRYLRQDEKHATLPVLFLTTEGQLQSRYHTARVGGDDHLVKPVVAPLLLSTVAARIERSRFVRQLLSRDGLTRLLTHTAFIEAAQAVQAKQQEDPSRPLAWVMIDVDHFKSVNDRFGHPVGDRVLASLAALLRRRFRQSDRVGRYGGEEFATLIEELPEAEVVRLVERLLAEFGAMEHHAADGEAFHTTFSAGVAMLTPGMSLDAWKQAADDALYAAKSAGRNRVMAVGGTSAPRAGEHGTQGSALGTR
jgi:diguanylate cyclase (GGDEF)-like protein